MLAMIKNLKKKVVSLKESCDYGRYSKFHRYYDMELSFSCACQQFVNLDELYAYFHHYYHHRCPKIILEHREYIMREKKGFGEDAFHAMWWLLLNEYKPIKMLEIGVYRGQSISLWALINAQLNHRSEIHGISPFSPLGDSVSTYLKDLDYMEDVRETFRDWNLPAPVLVKALSTDAKAISHIESQEWDLIYIDGSHDRDIVLADYKLCSKMLAPGGLLVLDDASLNTNYHPPSFAFAGHPGPSFVAREHADKEMLFLGAVGHNNIYKKKQESVSKDKGLI